MPLPAPFRQEPFFCYSAIRSLLTECRLIHAISAECLLQCNSAKGHPCSERKEDSNSPGSVSTRKRFTFSGGGGSFPRLIGSGAVRCCRHSVWQAERNHITRVEHRMEIHIAGG